MKDFGPLHRYSCFPFEGYFSIMKKFIHGTRGFVNQLHINQTIGLAITRIPDIFTEIEETTGDLEKLAYNFRVKDFYNFSNNTKKNIIPYF